MSKRAILPLILPEPRPDALALKSAQHQGDPLADEALAEILCDGSALPGELLERARALAQARPEGAAARYLAFYTSHALLEEPAHWSQGRRMFERYGVLTLLTGITTLTESYAGVDNVVLMMSGRLSSKRAFRRLAETARFTLDVVSDGALLQGGRGVEALMRVRLLHAHVRRLCLERGFDEQRYGRPINQLAMSGTLMLFSSGILRSLQAIGVSLSLPEQRAYHDLWQHAGLLLGVEPWLLTDTLDQERELWERVKALAFCPNEHSVTLFNHLVEALERHAHDLPRSVLRQGGFLLKSPRFVRQFVGRCVDAEYAAHLGIELDASSTRQFALLRGLLSGGSQAITRCVPDSLLIRVDEGARRRVEALISALLEGEPASFDDPGFHSPEGER